MGTLTALKVKNAKPGDKLGDKLGDGDGLRLDVDKNGNASWLSRGTRTGARIECDLWRRFLAAPDER